MRNLLLIAGTLLIATGSIVHAEERRFPYEAIVDAEDGEFVYSGSGGDKKFYPTGKLRKGDRVMVHRHDFGWCAIAPPPQSFSWIRAEHVQRSETNTGILKTSKVVVHVGSALNQDDFSIVQGSLSKGTPVEILGEREFQSEDGPRLMYKIRPIKNEFRWIPRKSIVAVDAIKSDPFPEDSPNRKSRRGPVAELDADNFAKLLPNSTISRDDDLNSPNSGRQSSENGTVRRTGTASDPLAPGRQKLSEIDQQFRDMIRLDPPEWNLDSLQSQYQTLDDDVNQESLTALIALRLEAVKRYRKIHKDYVDLDKLSMETKQKDAQLTSLQSQGATNPQALVTPNSATPNLPATSPPPGNPILQPSPQQSVPGQPPQTGAAPAFDGAGIVQRMSKSFPGGPQFVLIAPDGRMLTFLHPTQGVDLNRYVGRSMGIVGQRVRREEWNADVIIVRSLQPVQLRDSR